jgi:hypothetical protein
LLKVLLYLSEYFVTKSLFLLLYELTQLSVRLLYVGIQALSVGAFMSDNLLGSLDCLL